MRVHFFLALLLFPACVWSGSFKDAQKRYPRVREAYAHTEAAAKTAFAKVNVPYPPTQLLLRAFKREKRLELWARGSLRSFTRVKDYAVCRSSGALGPKRVEGDWQVPEGFYEISEFNPQSQYHLSLRVSYPNASDRMLSDKRRPGGDIFIHGDCVTIGCLPLTDRWIEELYVIAVDTKDVSRERLLVQVFPTELTDNGLTYLAKVYPGKPELLAFWKNLQPGFLKFEMTKVPEPVEIGADGKYRW